MCDNGKMKKELINELSQTCQSVARKEKPLAPPINNNMAVQKQGAYGTTSLNQGFLETLTDNIPDLVWAKDMDGRFLFVNKAMCTTLLKCTNQEEAIGKTDMYFATKLREAGYRYDFGEMYFESDGIVQNEKKPIKFNDFGRVNGRSIFVECYKAPLYDGMGSMVGTVGYGRDITDQKQAVDALHKYEFMANASNDFMTLINKDYVYEAANDAYCKTRNKKREEIVGHTVEELWGSQIFEAKIRPNIDQCFSGTKVNYEDTFAFDQNSELNTYEVIYYPYIDNAGKVTHAVIITHDITERKLVQVKLEQSINDMQRIMDGAIQVLASTIEMRDPYTAGHQQRVTQLACAIAKEMGIRESGIRSVYIASMLHDIGKIQVPSDILNKPGKIGENEYNMIKQHPRTAYDILKGVEFQCPVADIVLQHHERMNGSGYPNGLQGEEITIEAKILAVADVVESMASHRPYRPALGIDMALKEITENKGSLYDADVVNICARLFEEKGFKFK